MTADRKWLRAAASICGFVHHCVLTAPFVSIARPCRTQVFVFAVLEHHDHDHW